MRLYHFTTRQLAGMILTGTPSLDHGWPLGVTLARPDLWLTEEDRFPTDITFTSTYKGKSADYSTVRLALDLPDDAPLTPWWELAKGSTSIEGRLLASIAERSRLWHVHAGTVAPDRIAEVAFRESSGGYRPATDAEVDELQAWKDEDVELICR